jgi:hypothetical protein
VFNGVIESNFCSNSIWSAIVSSRVTFFYLSILKSNDCGYSPIENKSLNFACKSSAIFYLQRNEITRNVGNVIKNTVVRNLGIR